MKYAHLPYNTLSDVQLKDVANVSGPDYRKDFLDL